MAVTRLGLYGGPLFDIVLEEGDEAFPLDRTYVVAEFRGMTVTERRKETPAERRAQTAVDRRTPSVVEWRELTIEVL